MADTKIFTLEGKGLKLDTAAHAEPHLKALQAMSDVEQVSFGGNTLGVEACAAIASVLETKKTLQVDISKLFYPAHLANTPFWQVANFDDIFTGRLLDEIPQALSSLLTALLKLPKLHTVSRSVAPGLTLEQHFVNYYGK
jgi:Ran GTPase-activating protein 1